MPQALKVLIAEDNPVDAELIVRELRGAGFAPDWQRVETAAAFQAGLHAGLDLVISDYAMPEFGGPAALELIQQSGLEVPFIIVSGTIGEDVAVAIMKQGATDYLLKDRLARLGVAVTQAMVGSRLRRERRQVDQSAQRQHAELQVLFDLMPAALWFKDADNRILRLNQRAADGIGQPVAEIEGKYTREIYPPEEAAGYDESAQEVIRSGAPKLGIVKTWRNRAGEERWVEKAIVPVHDMDGKVRGVIVMAQDITERKRVEQELHRHQNELQLLFDLIPAMLCFKDTENRFLRVNRRLAETTGRPVEAIEGKSATEIFPREAAKYHADDLEVIRSGAPKLGIIETLRGRDGEERWVQTDKVPCRDDEGKVTGLVVMVQDITERKRSEELLRESEERFRSVFTAAATGIAVSTPQGRFLQANAAYCRMLGYTEEELCARDFVSLTHPDDLALNLKLRDEVLAGRRENFALEKRYLRKNGDIVWTSHSVSTVRAASGEIAAFIVVAENITERKQAEKSLQLLSAAVMQARESILITDAALDLPGPRIVFVNPAYTKITGYAAAESIGHTPRILQGPRTDKTVLKRLRETLGRGEFFEGQAVNYRKDGTPFEMEWQVAPVRDAENKITHFVAIQRDITAAKKSETRFRWLVDSNVQSVFFWNTKGEISGGNDAFLQLVRHSREDLEAGRLNWAVMTPPEYAHLDQRALDQITATGVCTPYQKEWIRRDGTRVPILIGAAVFEDNPNEGVCFVLDLTERVKSEEALRLSEKRFKTLFEQAAVGVAQAEVTTGRIVQINQRYSEILNRGRAELEQLTFIALSHPEDAAREQEMFRQLCAGTRREFTREKRYLRQDGSEVWASLTVSAMWAPGETPDYVIAVAQDVTERKKLEEQFRQAQKMEAIGTLAGGIAHDFNNILAAINGFTQLAQLKLEGNSAVREYLASILQAGNRATALVRQILAFSRQEQLQRATVALRPIVEESLKLLRAAIPATIQIDQSLAADVPTVLADSTQIHQILMNLGTNAWHAMRESPGRLEVKLEKWVVDAVYAAAQPRLRPGVYARISISDTGCGMDRATLQRIFDPFFTTKPAGEGTGLGLAVVHGIMQSHEGAVTVYSQPGEGTVFHLYFPAYAGIAVAAAGEEEPVPHGQGEEILFVDDETLLVEMGRQILVGLGYQVEVATLPTIALALVRSEPQRFALVITDQTMPGMTGMELASQLRQIRPDLPMLLMTGYGMALTPERVQAAGIHQLLLKPATIHALGAAVYSALSARPPH